MGFLNRLYDVYMRNLDKVGVEENNKRALLPLNHTFKNANIEVIIDGDGNFLRAEVIEDKSQINTIIAATEESACARTNGPCPHGLQDNLEYVAGDFYGYVDVNLQSDNLSSVDNKKLAERMLKLRKTAQIKNKLYLDQLEKFAAYTSNAMVKAVFAYLSKKCLTKDLIEQDILLAKNDKVLFEGDKSHSIYSAVAGKIENAFVRFSVEIVGEPETKTYRSQQVWQAWSDYYMGVGRPNGLCYASGKVTTIARKHPGGIRSNKDGAKLISSQVDCNFTYRGRFTEASQACEVGADISSKAHAALKWLIDKQAYKKNEHTLLCFASSGVDVPNPMEEVSIFDEDETAVSENTGTQYALRVKKALSGYKQSLAGGETVCVINLDSATPGRLSVIYNREFDGQEFIKKIENWYDTLNYEYTVRDFSGKRKIKPNIYTRTPSPQEIILASYGENVNDKLRHNVDEQIYACIIDDRPLPFELVKNAVRLTSNKLVFENNIKKLEKEKNPVRLTIGGIELKSDDIWENVLSTTCALYKKYYSKENYCMALDNQKTSRDYLYGRLLAVADTLERRALSDAGESRPTSATRLFAQFSVQPYRMWGIIRVQLNPYIIKLGVKANYAMSIMDEIMSLFNDEDFTSNKALSGEYLLGYHHQRKDIHAKENNIEEENV